MKKLFIDSDVFLDVLLNREKFSAQSSKIFDLSIANSHRLYTSAICISNIYYMCSSMIGKQKTKQNLQIVKPLFEIAETSDLAIEQALNSDFADLEDAFQHYTALENSLDVIITRNIKDFKLSEIPVLTPSEFLATLN
tara:strand:+ start:15229 stop:15642 length:414 start_codon:yes stop_codon:yes gene_type:complete